MIKFNKFWEKVASYGDVNVIENGEHKTVRLSESYVSKITGLSTQTLDALKPVKEGLKKKRGTINMSNIDKLCEFFECQPCDLMEYVNDEEDC